MLGLLLQTSAIMGQSINRAELASAGVGEMGETGDAGGATRHVQPKKNPRVAARA